MFHILSVRYVILRLVKAYVWLLFILLAGELDVRVFPGAAGCFLRPGHKFQKSWRFGKAGELRNVIFLAAELA